MLQQNRGTYQETRDGEHTATGPALQEKSQGRRRSENAEGKLMKEECIRFAVRGGFNQSPSSPEPPSHSPVISGSAAAWREGRKLTFITCFLNLV